MCGPSVVIHYHIYKNAGSSVDAMLRASFGDGWQAFEGLTRAPKTAEEIRRLVEEELAAVNGQRRGKGK